MKIKSTDLNLINFGSLHKWICIMGVLLIASAGIAQEEPPRDFFQFRTFGIGVTDSCRSAFSPITTDNVAIADASERAKEVCNRFIMDHVPEVASTEVIRRITGSCWAGTPSSAVVELRFKCKKVEVEP